MPARASSRSIRRWRTSGTCWFPSRCPTGAGSTPRPTCIGGRPTRWCRCSTCESGGGSCPGWRRSVVIPELLGQATDALLRYVPLDASYLGSGGRYYTVQTHISHLRQLFAGDRVGALTQILGWDD